MTRSERAGLAVALRIIPHYERHAAGWIAFLVVLIALCAAASVYLVYVLEIFKFRSLRARQMRNVTPGTSEDEIDEQVQRDVETGEFDKVG